MIRRVGTAETTRTRGVGGLLLAGLLFSTGGAAIKGVELSGLAIAGGRSALAAAVLLIALPGARRAMAQPRVWLAGIAYAATMVLFVVANTKTSAAHTVFLQATAPLWLLLLGPWLLRERTSRSDLALLPTFVVGMVLVFLGGHDAAGVVTSTGNWLAALAGLTWAITLIGLRALGSSKRAMPKFGSSPPSAEAKSTTEDVDAASATAAAAAAGNVICAVACLAVAGHEYFTANANDWLIVTFLGVFQVGLAYVFLSRAIPHVPVVTASLVLLIEPVCAPIWAWLVHREDPGTLTLCGGAVLVAALALRQRVTTNDAE